MSVTDRLAVFASDDRVLAGYRKIPPYGKAYTVLDFLFLFLFHPYYDQPTGSHCRNGHMITMNFTTSADATAYSTDNPITVWPAGAKIENHLIQECHRAAPVLCRGLRYAGPGLSVYVPCAKSRFAGRADHLRGGRSSCTDMWMKSDGWMDREWSKIGPSERMCSELDQAISNMGAHLPSTTH